MGTSLKSVGPVSSTTQAEETVMSLKTGGRRRRGGFAALGLLFVVLAALGAVAVFQSLRESVPVLVLDRDLAAGEILMSSDLVVVELGADGLGVVPYVAVSDQESVIGLSSLGPLPKGSLVTEGMFGERSDVVPTDMTVVGAVLTPGALPAGQVVVGDEVELIVAVDRVAVDAESSSAAVVGRGQIWALEEVGEFEAGTSVSLLVESSLAAEVAQAASNDRLRLGLVE